MIRLDTTIEAWATARPGEIPVSRIKQLRIELFRSANKISFPRDSAGRYSKR